MRVDCLRNAGDGGGGGEYRQASSHPGRGRTRTTTTTTTTGGKPSTRNEALVRSVMARRRRRDDDARYARGRTARTGGGTGGGTTCDAAAAWAGMRRWHRRAKGKWATAPNQKRQDEGDATMTSKENFKGRGEVATRGCTSMIDAGGAKEGVRRRHGGTAARQLINKKIPTLLNNTIFLAPPSRIRPSRA